MRVAFALLVIIASAIFALSSAQRGLHYVVQPNASLTFGCVPPCKCATRMGDLTGSFDVVTNPTNIRISKVSFTSKAASQAWTGSGSGIIASDGGPIFWNFKLTDKTGKSWNFNGTSANRLPVINVNVSGQRQCRDESFHIAALATK